MLPIATKANINLACVYSVQRFFVQNNYVRACVVNVVQMPC